MMRFERGFIHTLVRQRAGLHSHPAIEIVLHTKGKGFDVTEDGHELAFSRHSVCIHGYNRAHAQVNLVTGEDVCVQLLANEEIDERIGEYKCIPYLADAFLRDELINLASIKTVEPKASVHLRVQAVLMDLLDLADEQPLEQVQSLEQKIAAARQYIEQHFDVEMSIEDAAQHVDLSADYFRHCFSDIYGQSPRDFLMHLRIEHAKMLLSYTPMLQREIAVQSGFSNMRYFNTRFKHYTGISPGQYRKTHALS